VKDFLYSLDLFLIKFKKLGESHVWNITDSKASFMHVSEQNNYSIIQQRPIKNDNSTFQIFTPIMPQSFFSPTLRGLDLWSYTLAFRQCVSRSWGQNSFECQSLPAPGKEAITDVFFAEVNISVSISCAV
jgi:hypothetical protein